MRHFQVVAGKHKPWDEFGGVVSTLVDGSLYDVYSRLWPIPFDFIVPGLEFEASLHETQHPIYGLQYRAESDIKILNKRYAVTVSAIRKNLNVTLTKRLKVLAGRFGDKLFCKLREVECAETPLCELVCKSVKEEHVRKLISNYNNIKHKVCLAEAFPPIDTNMAIKYADLLDVKDVKTNPYVLFWRKPKGRLPFNPLHIADAVAKQHLEPSLQMDDLRRLDAYFEAALYQLQRNRCNDTNGCIWFEKKTIKKAMLELQSTDDVEWAFDASMLDEMFENTPKFIATHDNLVARSIDDRTERILASRLTAMNRQQNSDNMTGIVCLALFSRLERGDDAARDELDSVYTHWALVFEQYAKCDEHQRSTLRLLAERRVIVLTGGAGTGKSTTLALVVLFMQFILKVSTTVCALTGKAVDRMKQLFHANPFKKIDCRTLHSQAAVNTHSQSCSERTKALAIDEASMAFPAILNQIITEDLLYLVICGDDKQLPSIDPGAFLRDILAADVFPLVCLEHVYRTGEGSGIATEAPKIFLHGDSQLSAEPLNIHGFNIVLDCDLDIAVREFGRLVHQSSSTEVVMISNTRRTCKDANRKLQPICNSAAADRSTLKLERPDGATPWVVGDRVISNENIDLEHGERIFNGMLGCVDAIDLKTKKLTVTFRDLSHEFGAGDRAIEHAYCVTTWKFQGSEISHAIVFFDSSWGLSCELFYTAVTRGQLSTTAYISQQHLNIALATRLGPKRVTHFATRIKAAHKKRIREVKYDDEYDDEYDDDE